MADGDRRTIGDLRRHAAQAMGEDYKDTFASWMVEEEKWFGEPDGPPDTLKYKQLAERMFASPPDTLVERGTSGPAFSEQFATVDELRDRARAAGKASGHDGFSLWLVKTEGWFVEPWHGPRRQWNEWDLARQLWTAPGETIVFRDGRTPGFKPTAIDPSSQSASGRLPGSRRIMSGRGRQPLPAEKQGGGGLACLGCLGLIGLLALLGAGYNALTGALGSDKEDEVGAKVMCENFVEDRLKSPSSADFGDWSSEIVDDDTWTITGEVDADNSFGASIRSEYECTVTYEGNDEWRLESLEIR